MTNKPLNVLIRRMRVATQSQTTQELSDSELLDQFVRSCDQAAFELLVWRHGTMVFNLCLRVLHHEHDAEDAFQATFLVLARKAGALGNRKSVGSWLYKVAYRVALRGRASLSVQSLPNSPLVDNAAGDAVRSLIGRELSSVIDEELDRLSEKYRTAFVLCEMEGHSIEAAARILCCPPGTIGTRLARARSMLRQRLIRRGFDIPATVSARMLFAAVPASLVGSTVRAALSGTTSQVVSRGLISTRVANLTNGVLVTMILKKWVKAFSVVVGLCLFGGVALKGLESQAVETGQPLPHPAPKQSEDKDAGVVLEWKFTLNRPIHQDTTIEVDQIIKTQGQVVKQKQSHSYYIVWTPMENLGDSWRFRLTIQGLRLKLSNGDVSSLTFDSTKDQESDRSLFNYFEALIGAEFTVTLNKEWKVQNVDGREAILKKHANANHELPALESVMNLFLREDSLSQLAEMSFGGLPRGTIRPGEDWSAEGKLGAKVLEEFPVTDRFTYAGLEGKLDKITIKVESNSQGRPRAMKKPGNVVLRRLEGSGVQFFDRVKGCSVSSERNLLLEGKFTSLVNGQETEMDIAQTQKTTIKTTDAVPINWTVVPTDSKDREIERLKEENARLREKLRVIEEVLRKKQE
jgi:RNA polymerase sigma factor (sigma-70 family)